MGDVSYKIVSYKFRARCSMFDVGCRMFKDPTSDIRNLKLKTFHFTTTKDSNSFYNKCFIKINL